MKKLAISPGETLAVFGVAGRLELRETTPGGSVEVRAAHPTVRAPL